MKKALLLLAVLYCFVFSNRTYAQGEVPVDMYTGQPFIGIPITTVTSNDISVPVELTYDINSADNKGAYGYGWNLSAGGSISRELRGLPDDFGYNVSRKGWLYNNSSGVSVAQDIGNFVPSADTLLSSVADEAADYSKLSSFYYLSDTEPDVFNYSFGNVSGSFVFDNNLVIRTIPYRDIKIEPIYASSSNKKIVSFKITTNDGFSYTFGQACSATRRTVKSQYLDGVHFLTTDYELYSYDRFSAFVDYNAEWRLTRIDSPNGSYVTFVYNPGSESSQSDVNIGFYKEIDPNVAGSTDLEVRNIYRIDQTVPRYTLSNITGSTGSKVDFKYTSGKLEQVNISDTRKGSTFSENFVKSFNLSYSKVDYLVDSYYDAYSRYFLSSITEVSVCDKMPPITFKYKGISGATAKALTTLDAWGYESGYANAGHSMPKLYIYPGEPEKDRYRLTPIPGYSGTQIILNGVERNASSMGTMGSLASITYPHGSVTTFEFGPHRYFDSRANKDELAGGLRIESISYFDGFNQTPVKKIFEYTNPTGKSSGRLLRRPMLSMPVFKWKNPYDLNSTKPISEKRFENLTGDDVWKYLTMRTESDIAPAERTKGSTVGYTFVTVKRPGAGKATFEYHEPGTYGQGVNGEWSSTINRFARPNFYSTIPTTGLVTTGGPWRFPHVRNPNFDYERGLVYKKSDFNEAGKLVQKTETTYQYIYGSGSAPLKVWGLYYDKLALSGDGYVPDTSTPDNTIYMYGRYFLLAETDKVPHIETITTYDVNDPTGTKYITESTEYLYQSAYHKLLTKVKHTSGDGSIRTSYLKYPKDYPAISSNAENAVQVLNTFATTFRHGSPVETVTTLKPNNGTERVTAASIVKYDLFNTNQPLPASVWSLNTKSTIAIDSFIHSSIQLENGTYKLRIDDRYRNTATFSAYTSANQLISSTDVQARTTTSNFYDATRSLPIVKVVNALQAQVGFSDFESTTGLEFSSATPYYGAGRTGKNAFYPGVMLHRTINKAPVANYVLAFWINSNASVNFTVNLKDLSGATTYSTVTVSVPATGGNKFKYVQKRIPVQALPAWNFRIELQANGLSASPAGGSSPSLLPVIDDVFFFPEDAEMASVSYHIPFGVSMTTTGTGDAGRTVYDNLGRLQYVMDREGNIVKKNTYKYLLQPDPLVAQFVAPTEVFIGQSVTFNAISNSCLTDVTYWWDFGDGFIQGSATATHIFPSGGSFSVILKVSHPEYGEKTYTSSVLVKPEPFSAIICARGVKTFTGTSVTETYPPALCPQITATPPPLGVIFKVISTTGCTDNCTYTWKMKEEGAFSWVTVATGSDQFTYQKVTPNTKNFHIMCEVGAAGVSGSGASNPVSVTIIP